MGNTPTVELVEVPITKIPINSFAAGYVDGKHYSRTLVLYCGDATRDPCEFMVKSLYSRMMNCDRICVYLFKLSNVDSLIKNLEYQINNNWVAPNRDPSYTMLDIYIADPSWMRVDATTVSCDGILVNFRELKTKRIIRESSISVYYSQGQEKNF